jgi:hypothetical protein
MLAGLRAPALRSVVGIDNVHEALRLLGASEDAAFAAKVARVVVAIGGSVEPDEAPAAVGLWNLAPTPLARENRPSPWDPTRENSWGQVWSGYAHPDQRLAWLVDLALADISLGELSDGSALVGPVTQLLGEGQLRLRRLARALEDLFLGGGMRQGWECAMAIADACCAAPRKPAGLADLLRMLASYANEVSPHDLPLHVVALAAAAGETKAQMEARRLGATLSGNNLDR